MAVTSAAPNSALISYHRTSRDLLHSLVMILPLMLLYQFGLYFTGGVRNGVDFLTDLILLASGGAPHVYLGIQAALLLAMVGTLIWFRHKRSFALRCWPWVIAESTLYALFFGQTVLFLMGSFHPGLALSTAPLHESSLLARFTLSLGAGVFEELVFRLALLGGAVAFARKVLDWPRWTAVIIFLLLSSLIFSAVHHLGPLADPFTPEVFAFRFIAGLLLGLLFIARGLAIVVYTHAIYDLLVLL